VLESSLKPRSKIGKKSYISWLQHYYVYQAHSRFEVEMSVLLALMLSGEW